MSENIVYFVECRMRAPNEEREYRNVCLWVTLFFLQFGVNVILVSHFYRWTHTENAIANNNGSFHDTNGFWMRQRMLNGLDKKINKAFINDCTHWMIISQRLAIVIFSFNAICLCSFSFNCGINKFSPQRHLLN